MTESKNGGTIFLVTKEHNEDLMEIFKTENKPRSLTNKEKLDSANMKMHKEEIKERVKELKIIKSNLKKTVQSDMRKLHRESACTAKGSEGIRR